MAHTYNQKMMAEIDGDFVVFLIGARINKPWKVHKWLPVFLAMPRMMREVAARPESGFLGSILQVARHQERKDRSRGSRASREERVAESSASSVPPNTFSRTSCE